MHLSPVKKIRLICPMRLIRLICQKKPFFLSAIARRATAEASGTEAKNGGQGWIGDCFAIPRLRFATAQTIYLTAIAGSAVVRTQPY